MNYPEITTQQAREDAEDEKSRLQFAKQDLKVAITLMEGRADKAGWEPAQNDLAMLVHDLKVWQEGLQNLIDVIDEALSEPERGREVRR